MFIRLKNAQRAGHEALRVPYSKFKYEILCTLSRSGFVGSVERKGKRIKKFIEVALLYPDGKAAIRNLKILSTPGRRLYINAKDVRLSPRGGIIILSTTQGVMNEKEARKARIGGALIAEVW